MSIIQHISIKTASHFSWGNGSDGYWLKKDGPFTIISEIMPNNTAEKRHFHRNTEQFFYCLNGVLNIELNDEKYILHEGDGINVPPSIPHKVYNSSGKNTHFLVISCAVLHKRKLGHGSPNFVLISMRLFELLVGRGHSFYLRF